MKLTNRERVLLPLVLIIVLSALFINFVYLPISKDIKELKVHSQELDNKIIDLKLKDAELVNLRSQATDLAAQIENDNKDIMTIWDQAVLLASLEKLMINQADQTSIDFMDVVSVNHLQTGEVDMSFKTNYTNYQSIIKKLSDSKYFNTIPSYSVEKILTGSGEATDFKYNLEVSLKLQFYSLSLEQSYPDKYDFMTGGFGKKDLFQ